MSLDIGAALSDGLDRTFKRNALLLMGVFLVVGLASTAFTQTFTAGLDTLAPTGPSQPSPGPFGGQGGQTPLAVPFLPVAIAGVLALLLAVVAEMVRIVAVRTLVSDETETIPDEFVRHNMALATVNSIIGNLVAGVLIVIGLLFFIIPGIFLAISFFFVRQEIAIEDKNFIDALADSWALAKGDRIELFALAVVVVVIGLLANIPSAVLAFVSPLATTVASVVIGAITTVFGIAVSARAYDQLRAERETETETEDDEPGALGADDIEEPSI